MIMHYDCGFQSKMVGNLLASLVLKAPGETLVVHHVTNYTDYVQLELERITVNTVSFERIRMTETSQQIMNSYLHTNPFNLQDK